MRPPIRSGRPATAALSRSTERSSIGRTWFSIATLGEEILHLFQLGWIGLGEIVDEAEIVAGVVKLPFVIREARARLRLPGRFVDCPGEPAIMVDGAVADDFEILCQMPIRRVGSLNE